MKEEENEKFDDDFDSFDGDDMGFDNDDFDFGPKIVKDDRKPFVKMADQFGTTFKDKLLSTETAIKVAKQAMPSDIGRTIDTVDDVMSDVADLYDHTAKTIKPFVKSMKRSARTFKKSLGNALPDGLSKWIDEKLEDNDDRYGYGAGPSEEELKENQIQQTLTEIFQKQETVRGEERQEDKIFTVSSIRQQGEMLKMDDKIYRELVKLTSYQDQINRPWQMKMLELSIRQWQTQTGLLKGFDEYRKVAIEMLQGIQYNTALPDIQKSKKTEVLKDLGLRRLFEYSNKMLADSSISQFSKRVTQHLKNKVSDFSSTVLDQISQSIDMVSGMAGGQDDDFTAEVKYDESDRDKQLRKLADMAGSGAAGYVSGKFADKLGGWLNNNKTVRGIAQAAANVNRNGGRIANQFLKDGGFKGDGAVGNFFNSLMFDYLDLGRVAEYETRKSLSFTSTDKMHDVTEFTNFTQKSITEIIPGYLARILQSTESIRTGQPVGLTLFSFEKDTFVSDESIKAKMFKSIIEDRKDNVTRSLDETIGKLTGTGKLDELEESDIKELRKYMMKFGRTGDSFDLSKFYNTQLDELNITKDLKNLIKSNLHKNLGDAILSSSDNEGISLWDRLKGYTTEEKGKWLNDFHSTSNRILSSIPNFIREIEEYAIQGTEQLRMLKELGLVEADGSNSHRILNDNIFKMYLGEDIGDKKGDQSHPIFPTAVAAAGAIKKNGKKTKRMAKRGNKNLGGNLSPIVNTGPVSTGVYSAIDYTDLLERISSYIKPVSQYFTKKLQTATGVSEENDTTSEIVESILGQTNTLMGALLQINKNIITVGQGVVANGATIAWNDIRPDELTSNLINWNKLARYTKTTASTIYNAASTAITKSFNFARKTTNAIINKSYDLIMGTKDKIMSMDIYLPEDLTKAVVTIRDLAAGKFQDAQGNIVRSLHGLKGNLYDQYGNIVLTVEEMKTKIVDRFGVRIDLKSLGIRLGEFGSKIWNKTKMVAQFLNPMKALRKVKDFAVATYKKMKEFSMNDLYVGDEQHPRITGMQLMTGAFWCNGKRLYRAKDIVADVVDINNKPVLTLEEVRNKGLFDKNRKPYKDVLDKALGRLGTGAAILLGGVKAGWNGIKKIGSGIGRGITELFKGFQFGIDFGAKWTRRIYELLVWKFGGKPAEHDGSIENDELAKNALATQYKDLKKKWDNRQEAIDKLGEKYSGVKDKVGGYYNAAVDKGWVNQERVDNLKEKLDKYNISKEKITGVTGRLLSAIGIDTRKKEDRDTPMEKADIIGGVKSFMRTQMGKTTEFQEEVKNSRLASFLKTGKYWVQYDEVPSSLIQALSTHHYHLFDKLVRESGDRIWVNVKTLSRLEGERLTKLAQDRGYPVGDVRNESWYDKIFKRKNANKTNEELAKKDAKKRAKHDAKMRKALEKERKKAEKNAKKEALKGMSNKDKLKNSLLEQREKYRRAVDARRQRRREIREGKRKSLSRHIKDGVVNAYTGVRRAGSWRNIKKQTKRVMHGAAALPGKIKDAFSKGGLFGMLGAGALGALSLLGTTVLAPFKLAWNIVTGIVPVVGKISDILSPVANLLMKGIKLLGSGAMNAVGWVVRGGLATAASAVTSAATTAIGAVGSAGVYLLTNPVGWAILGATLVGTTAYLIWDHFRDTIQECDEFRIAAYGLHANNNLDKANKMLAFEKALDKELEMDEATGKLKSLTIDERKWCTFFWNENAKEGQMSEEAFSQQLERFSMWYKLRFAPNYARCREALFALKKAGVESKGTPWYRYNFEVDALYDIDSDLYKAYKPSWVRMAYCNKGVLSEHGVGYYEYEGLPFPDHETGALKIDQVEYYAHKVLDKFKDDEKELMESSEMKDSVQEGQFTFEKNFINGQIVRNQQVSGKTAETKYEYRDEKDSNTLKVSTDKVKMVDKETGEEKEVPAVELGKTASNLQMVRFLAYGLTSDPNAIDMEEALSVLQMEKFVIDENYFRFNFTNTNNIEVFNYQSGESKIDEICTYVGDDEKLKMLLDMFMPKFGYMPSDEKDIKAFTEYLFKRFFPVLKITAIITRIRGKEDNLGIGSYDDANAKIQWNIVGQLMNNKFLKEGPYKLLSPTLVKGREIVALDPAILKKYHDNLKAIMEANGVDNKLRPPLDEERKKQIMSKMKAAIEKEIKRRQQERNEWLGANTKSGGVGGTDSGNPYQTNGQIPTAQLLQNGNTISLTEGTGVSIEGLQLPMTQEELRKYFCNADGTFNKRLNPVESYGILKPIFEKVAEGVGVPLDTLVRVAAQESSFNPYANAGNASSAKGIFQFIDSAWKDVTKKHGPKYGITEATSRYDPVANILMGGHLLRDKIESIKKSNAEIGINGVSIGDLYLSHFLGDGGHRSFMKALAKNPNAPVGTGVSMSQLASNRQLFGQANTLAEFRDLMSKKMLNNEVSKKVIEKYGIQDTSSQGVASAQGTGITATATPAQPTGAYGGQPTISPDGSSAQPLQGVGSTTTTGQSDPAIAYQTAGVSGMSGGPTMGGHATVNSAVTPMQAAMSSTNPTTGNIYYSPMTGGTPTGSAPSSNLPWVNTALSQLGVHEDKNPDMIREYHMAAGLNKPPAGFSSWSDTPWCSSFINWCFMKAGMQPTRSALAVSWANWSGATRIERPAYGALMVTRRDKGHHVGIVVGTHDGKIALLGGNQSNSVCVSAYGTSKLVGFYFPNGYTPDFNIQPWTGQIRVYKSTSEEVASQNAGGGTTAQGSGGAYGPVASNPTAPGQGVAGMPMPQNANGGVPVASTAQIPSGMSGTQWSNLPTGSGHAVTNAGATMGANTTPVTGSTSTDVTTTGVVPTATTSTVDTTTTSIAQTQPVSTTPSGDTIGAINNAATLICSAIKESTTLSDKADNKSTIELLTKQVELHQSTNEILSKLEMSVGSIVEDVLSRKTEGGGSGSNSSRPSHTPMSKTPMGPVNTTVKI